MKISNILEILLILIIISFAASKPIDKESGRGVQRNHIKKGLIARQEPVVVAPVKPTVIEDDDDFDIADIFDVFDDDDDDEEESAEEDESAEEADDDDEPEFDDSDSDEEVEEVETDAEGDGDGDAFDLIADLLDDDDAIPKPKPSTAAPEVAQALDVTPGDDAADDDDIEEEVVEAVKPQITIQKVTETKPAKTKATKAPKKPKPTTAAPVPEKADLPPLNLQNTPALLELQAQLTANNVKGGDLSEEVAAPPKPTKTQKKKKTSQKGQGKKQAAITTNEVSETTEEKTRLAEATKPQVIVEDSVMMEKVPLKTPESEKMKKKQQVAEVEYFEEDEEAGEPEVIEVKS